MKTEYTNQLQRDMLDELGSTHMKTAEKEEEEIDDWIFDNIPCINKGDGIEQMYFGDGYFRGYKDGLQKLHTQLKPTPSSTVDLEREVEAREYYFKKTGNVIAENSRPDLVIGYIDGSNATSQKGLEELIGSLVNAKSLIERMALLLRVNPEQFTEYTNITSVTTKATELLTKK